MSRGPSHPPVAVKHQVIARDGGFCLLAFSECLGEAQTTDHRANRGQGGSRLLNDPVNLIAACSLCNNAKADARALQLLRLEQRGLWVRPDSTHAKTLERARRTPVEGLDGRWWMLLSATERCEVPPPVGGVLLCTA